MARIAARWIGVAVALVYVQATAAETPLTPVDVVADRAGKTLYVACETAGKVLVFDVESEKVTARYAVEGVARLAVADEQDRIYATAGGARGLLHELDRKSGRILRTLPAGHTPEALCLSADGKTLYYCNRFARADQPNVHAVDLASWKVRNTAKAVREPCASCLSDDGSTLWVGNYLPLMPANAQHVYAVVEVYDAATLKKRATLNLPAGAFAVRDMVMSRDGKTCFVSHSVGRFTVPTTHLDRGWINTSAVSIFDVAACRYVNSVLLDDTVKGAANPWGLGVVGQDAWLCVALSGTHEMMVVDLKEMWKRLAAAANPAEIVNDLSFLYGAKTRVSLEGQGAQGLAVCGERVFAAMRYADSLNLVEIWEDGPGAAVPLPLGPEPKPDILRLGEMAFNDATLCYQHWLSCASCHPETRSDGTNWDLMNDGIGNPKQSRSLLYSHRASPVMITGIRASAEVAVAKGFELIQFHELPQDRLDSVDAYIKAQEPVPSPYLNPDGSMTAAALRGKKIFEGKAACVKCHTPPYHSDKKKYTFGLGSDSERDRPFVTPILIEVWRTAPYMYDGRAVTIQDVITTDNVNNKHGNTRDLTPDEVEDLAEYVNSL
ncbi:MAG TPA: c-type cytochrome [Kiritimatiellia bacterium]|jgi:mono/diheme cytochrome c family protein|nr:c-type cytochrome [Kiritimatiellia bacterium]HOM59071.1 c-type cytochrome [Kiritimatiellia bacterium]HOR97257.1 c-type cytochrome [Kiritimatiellia bacterium]HPC48663.1 c-type cytochrome [Kiritimatiellia bacterium]HPW75297.1 c-type cytochrome [Kiritimatiellia bacterium]